MATQQISTHPIGWLAADFDLLGTDGKRHRLASERGTNGLLVMFICNHCPYVKAAQARIVRDCRELLKHGVGSVAIMSNDPHDYPEDSFENMKLVAREWDLPFAYLWDETQATARAYGAQCTPEFFGFNARGELQYHGRLDSAGRVEQPNAKRELFEAMTQIAATGIGPREQYPSVGCSIKWRGA